MHSDLNFTENTGQTLKPQYKEPKFVLENVVAFPPNKDILGGTSYLLLHPKGNILIDCPFWADFYRDFCLSRGVRYLFLTSRNGISKHIGNWKKALNCELVIQEQEAYLLPNLAPITFVEEYVFYEDCFAFWTPGYSPGSSCLYYEKNGGLLFSGRHLLPVGEGKIAPLRLPKTFHWPIQLRSVRKLAARLQNLPLSYILPGANTGYLRGKGYIDHGYEQILQILETYK